MPAASYSPSVLAHPNFSTRSGARLGLLKGYFVTAGAGVDPTDTGGCVLSVQQLDEGASSFYRVEVPEFFNTGLYNLVVTPRAASISDDLTVVTGAFTADGPGPGPWPFTAKMFDCAVRNAGALVTTAGIRIDFSLARPGI